MAEKPGEVAKLNAELAAEHLAVAEEKAAEAKEEANKKNPSLCPQCGGKMVHHDNPADPIKYGAWHCNNCGICWKDGAPR